MWNPFEVTQVLAVAAPANCGGRLGLTTTACSVFLHWEIHVPQPIHHLHTCFISLRLFTQASKLLYLKIRRMLHFSLTLCPQFKFFFKPYSFRYKLDSDVLIFVTWCYDWKPWLLNQFRVENWEVSICHLWQFHVCPQSCWAVKDDTWISIDCLISIKNMCRVYKFLRNSIRGEIE